MVTKLTFKQNSLIPALDKYIRWLLSALGKKVVTGIVVLITALLGWNLQYLQFDFEFEKFFPKNHPESIAYETHRAQFGYDNDYLHVVVERTGGVFDKEFLALAKGFEKSLSSIPDVDWVYSPLSLNHVVRSPTGLVIFPLIHTEKTNDYRLSQDSMRVMGNPFYHSGFSNDATALSIYINHAHFNDPARADKLLNAVDEKARTFGLQDIRIVGKLSAAGVFVSFIQKDFGKFLIGSLLLSFVLLLVIFRSWKSAFLPFLISIISIVWTFGLMGLLGIQINLLSSLLPPILFFASMSDAVHLMNAVKQSTNAATKDQLLSGVRKIWMPTLLTSATTAIGFLSLLWINTEPVQVLGLCAALGVFFAFMVTFSVGVLLVSWMRPDQLKSLTLPAHWTALLLVHKRKVWALSLIIVLVALPGIHMLKVDAYLLDDLPEDTPIRHDFDYVDEAFGGSKPFEVRVEVADSSMSIWDREVMDEIVKIEDYMLGEYPIVRVQSPATIMKYAHMVNNGGLNDYYSYPADNQSYKKAISLKSRIDPKRLNKLVTEDSKSARLVGFFPELGSYQTGLNNEQMMETLSQTVDDSIIDYRITGTTYLIDKSHELLTGNLLKGLLTAIAIVGLILGIYFRSWKLLFISLIPNLAPLLIIAGVLGWVGISLKLTTSIIFTVAFGIAVDDTIHMMSFYKKASEQSDTALGAIQETFTHAGSAILITTLVIVSGFCLYLFSSFGATFYMGLFVSLSLVVALVVDLTLLPLLLLRFSDYVKKRRKAS